MNELEWLNSTGAAQMLVELLKQKRYVSWFYRSEHNLKGIGSSKTVISTRNTLLNIGLIDEDPDSSRPRIYLRLTEKGRAIAEHLKAIQDLLMNP